MDKAIEAVARALQSDSWPRANDWQMYIPSAKAVIAAYQAASGEGWRPIETAPKDGTRLLLCNRRKENRPYPIMADGYWCKGIWVWCYPFSDPTHWLPLPAIAAREGVNDE